MPDNKKQGRSNKAMTFFVCFLAALAGLLFGLDIGVIAGALPFITDEFQITAHTQEWVVSSMMFGAAVGAVGSGWLSFKLGRKKSLMIGAILFVAGSLFSAAAPNVEVLIISRVLLGLAVGVASYTAPLYLSEIAPEKIRGSMISMYQLMITIGILGAYLSDTAFSYSGAWRWMLGVIIIPAILLLIGVFFLPDSPRWFAAKRRRARPNAALRRNAASMMLNASCCACVTPVRKQNVSSMKFAKVCRLNRAVGRCSKRTATSAAPCFLAFCCRSCSNLPG
ncbi:Arabinose-proton symporter [Salmonella enterica subsp. enterica serovar Uganda str. R8-3404]|uniref:Arabinose-proton symporter n=1 Tax=Salmonella enterica subsp. enterica serovar Uganda str. R8-3404 TaxID=913083 RepID=A0A6C8GXE1_SALET|nr:Arabinose-proton symporter [Salmonella enterica subsp. enterica serovar Uganda str. R8-3404]